MQSSECFLTRAQQPPRLHSIKFNLGLIECFITLFKADESRVQERRFEPTSFQKFLFEFRRQLFILNILRKPIFDHFGPTLSPSVIFEKPTPFNYVSFGRTPPKFQNKYLKEWYISDFLFFFEMFFLQGFDPSCQLVQAFCQFS